MKGNVFCLTFPELTYVWISLILSLNEHLKSTKVYLSDSWWRRQDKKCPWYFLRRCHQLSTYARVLLIFRVTENEQRLKFSLINWKILWIRVKYLRECKHEIEIRARVTTQNWTNAIEVAFSSPFLYYSVILSAIN